MTLILDVERTMFNGHIAVPVKKLNLKGNFCLLSNSKVDICLTTVSAFSTFDKNLHHIWIGVSFVESIIYHIFKNKSIFIRP